MRSSPAKALETKDSRLDALYRSIQSSFRTRYTGRFGQVFVPGAGNINSPLVFLGEAPGREEEEARSPFVGAAGRNLNMLLRQIGLSRDKIFITNVVKYRPVASTGARARNRPLTRTEIRNAHDWILSEIEIIGPKLVVCLGASASWAFTTGAAAVMAESAGTVVPYGRFQLFVTYHPSPLNWNNPQRRARMIEAFARLAQMLQHVPFRCA